MRATVPETIVDDLEIRDTNAHTPATDSEISFVDVHEWKGWTIQVNNTLDQDVTLTLYGNLAQSVTDADDYADTLAVAAGEVKYMSWHLVRCAWTPWIYASLLCGVQPASGNVAVQIVKMDKMKE